jgi:cyclopropane-fatty-acyl-phospholipid synthase
MIATRLAERVIRDVLSGCDVEVGGTRPWDLRIHDRAFYPRVLKNPGLEVGETYLDGLWDCDAQDELFFRLLSSPRARRHAEGWRLAARDLWARLANRQSRARAARVADAHYDLDVALYRAMLDETMTYTCAVWRDGDTLAGAQRRKLALICDKLGLAPGQTLLDIGCGFGGLAEYAARHRGARVLGITNSRDHAREAAARCAELPGVEIQCLDYRELPSLGRRFDHLASIEMIEAVGPANYPTYMEVARRCLLPGGRFLLQSFVSPTSGQVCNEWFDRHVFPNGVSPSLAQLAAAAQGRLSLAGLEELGGQYPPTLLAWDENLRRAWPALAGRHGERRRRLFHHYLRCMAGTFRSGYLRLNQHLYTRAAT